MNSWLVFGILAAVAYGVQILFGMHQIKQFNQVYQRMRRGGRVAIGRRPGRIQSGTIMLFALDARGVIKETQKMQGISVLAKFKTIDTFTDIALEALTPYHPPGVERVTYHTPDDRKCTHALSTCSVR